jgi:hypothetical protein
MKNSIATAAVAAALAALSSPAPGAEFRITPYGWVAGMDGRIGTSDPGGGGGGTGGRLQATLDSLSSNMDLGGFMLNADWRAGRWSVFGDWTYINVESGASAPRGLLYEGVDVRVKGNVVEAALGYAILDSGTSHVDAFAGVRYYGLEGRMSLREGLLAGRSATESASWADGVVGLRWGARLGEHWDVGLYGDVGAGGSDLTWQAIASIGYRFSWGSVVGGWRYLNVDYDKNKLKIDAAFTGPFIGASFRF